MTFQDYRSAVDIAQADNRNWRPGQAAFNVLHQYRPDLSEQVRATTLDPFHSTDMSSTLPRFYKWVEENWNGGTNAK